MPDADQVSDAAVLRRLRKARAQLVMKHPFFGTLALGMDLVERVGDPRIKTLATDGKSLFYNPSFVETLSDPELQGVVAHEVMHPASLHHTRRGARDLRAWNTAADFAVNPIIVGAGLTLPEGALISPAYADKSAEEIYGLLPKSGGAGGGGNPGGDDGDDLDPGGCGAVLDAPGTGGEDGKTASASEMAQAASEWKVKTLQAAQAAKMQGRLPAGLERLVEELRAPSVDWRDQLRRFVADQFPEDYSWTKPNRRFIGSGLILPSMIPDRIGEIAVAVDTSGSIGPKELAQFQSELQSIADEVRPAAIHVVYCDAKVAGTQTFEGDDQIKLKAKGGGGTDFRPPFDWIARNGVEPKCLIYLTDLCCSSFPKEPGYPVMWASTEKLGRPGVSKPPFGEVIHVNG